MARTNQRMPQNVHLMAKGARTTRLCGATTGGFIRVAEAAYLKKFLARGGGLCPECQKRHQAPAAKAVA